MNRPVLVLEPGHGRSAWEGAAGAVSESESLLELLAPN